MCDTHVYTHMHTHAYTRKHTHTCSDAHPQPHEHTCQQVYPISTIKRIVGASLGQFAHTRIRAHPYTQEEAASTLLADQVLADLTAVAVASAAFAIASEVSYIYHATRI